MTTTSHTLATLGTAATSVLVAVGLVACHVEKKQEGDVTLPKYEVQQTQQGNVTLPKYEVTPPEVTVGASQAQVTVPKVTTEQRTVTVPSIDVKSGAERKADAENQKR